MMPNRFHSSSILRYSVILFWRFLAAIRFAGLMFSSPINTRVTPARFDFSMKSGMRWQSVSTWIIKRTSMPSTSRKLMMRS